MLFREAKKLDKVLARVGQLSAEVKVAELDYRLRQLQKSVQDSVLDNEQVVDGDENTLDR